VTVLILLGASMLGAVVLGLLLAAMNRRRSPEERQAIVDRYERDLGEIGRAQSGGWRGRRRR